MRRLKRQLSKGGITMKYPFSVAQMENDGHVYWVAKSSQLDGCVGQGNSAEEALVELAENEEAWLETAKEVGIPIPDVSIEKVQTYSGKMTLRVSPFVHAQAAHIAKKWGISLNQYINDAVVAYNKETSIVGYMSANVSSITDQINRKFINGTSYNQIGGKSSITEISFGARLSIPNTKS